MGNARRCLVAVVARGTKIWRGTEERRSRRLDAPDTGLQCSQRHAEVANKHVVCSKGVSTTDI